MELKDIKDKMVLITYMNSSKDRYKEKNITLRFRYYSSECCYVDALELKSVYVEKDELLKEINYVNETYKEYDDKNKFSVLCNIIFWKLIDRANKKRNNMFIITKYILEKLY